MQEDYRIRARSNVMTLTRTRARLSGNQIGVCSSRVTASSPSLGSMPLPPLAAHDSDIVVWGSGIWSLSGMADIGQAAPIRLD